MRPARLATALPPAGSRSCGSEALAPAWLVCGTLRAAISESRAGMPQRSVPHRSMPRRQAKMPSRAPRADCRFLGCSRPASRSSLAPALLLLRARRADGSIGVTARDIPALTAFVELLDRVGAGRVEQPETRFGATDIRDDQRFRHQIGQAVDRLACLSLLHPSPPLRPPRP